MIKSVLDDVKPQLVYLTGGEPLLHPKLVELCTLLKQYGCEVKINTNAFDVERTVSICRQLNKMDLNFRVQVSLDGLRDTHDFIRQKGSFDRAMDTLHQLSQFCKVDVLSVINNYNWKEMPQLNRLLHSMKVKQNFELIRGETADSRIALPPLKKAYHLVKKMYIKEYSKFYTRFFQSLYFHSACKVAATKNSLSKCVVCQGEHIGVIYANGDVALCELIAPIGNLHNESFLAIWNGQAAISLRKRLTKCACTHGCFLYPSVHNLNQMMRYAIRYYNPFE